MRDYRLVSSDSHLEVSPDQWRSYVDREFRSWVPTVIRLPDGGDAWLMPGPEERTIPLRLQFGAGRRDMAAPTRYADNPPGSGDAKQRLEEMDIDGVDADVLFPAVQGQRSLDRDVPREALIALARGYNDWLSQEFTAADPDRLFGVAILPTTGIEDAIDELERVATMPGIRLVVLHEWPNGSPRSDPEDDRFWRVAGELGVPITAHARWGGGMAADAATIEDSHKMQITTRLKLMNRAGGLAGPDIGHNILKLICEGVLDRFPSMRLLLAEVGIGWVPYFAEQADLAYHRWRESWSTLELRHEPSWYIERHFLFGFQDEFLGIQQRHLLGLGNMAWGTDFPHSATDWPHSRQLIDRMFEGVPEGDKKKIVCDNILTFLKIPVAQTTAA
jgi:predicted TIM-barrel fold metal-dependent hydrolase